MQLPQRRSQQFRKYDQTDNHLTAAAVAQLQADLKRLQTTRPKVVEELSQAREMGDLSENAAYQQAKARLTSIDFRVLEIKEKLKNAIIIDAGVELDGRVRLGCRVTVVVGGQEKTYEIVGAQEANPSAGRLSHLSPVGQALLGHRTDETIEVKINDRFVEYRLVRVE